MKVLVCGGRDYNNDEILNTVLLTHHLKNTITEIIEGGALGADRLARNFAAMAKVKVTTVEAQWNRFGTKAGYIRNVAMADMAPDLVIAFPGGKGTAMMVKIARERGIQVKEIK